MGKHQILRSMGWRPECSKDDQIPEVDIDVIPVGSEPQPHKLKIIACCNSTKFSCVEAGKDSG